MKTKTIILVAMTLLLASCSSKKNTVNSLSSPYSTISAGVSGTQANELNQLKSQYQCQRIADTTFSSNQAIGGNGALPTGALQAGGYATGSVTGVFAGVSAYGDLIVIKTLSGGGFTATLSFCHYPYWINASSTVTAFMLQSGTIANVSGCSVGRVIANNTQAAISNSGTIPTSFGPVQLSCQSSQYTPYNNYNY